MEAMERAGRRSGLPFALLALAAIVGMGTLAWLARSGAGSSRYAVPALVLLLLLYMAMSLLELLPKPGGKGPEPALASSRIESEERDGHPALENASGRRYSLERIQGMGQKRSPTQGRGTAVGGLIRFPQSASG
ncbi:hypothetical protein [Rufibacter hautae]|uniref:Uncharacterized protein n=1 Tax=Rufibacter hautae TaxID=2595005 RepID=A0A5B6TDM0_9BACT|nr:hypothetical protein [Rufibacter hautae]KAA3437114.1 hypothetical protein FOA19_22375 [Rufibacter hautae]